MAKKQIRNVERDNPGKNGLFCQHTVRLVENGFAETTEVNNSFQFWEGVEKVTETENYVIIQVRLGSGYFIPKRAFSSVEQKKEFVAAFNKYTQNISAPPLPRSPDY